MMRAAALCAVALLFGGSCFGDSATVHAPHVPTPVTDHFRRMQTAREHTHIRLAPCLRTRIASTAVSYCRASLSSVLYEGRYCMTV